MLKGVEFVISEFNRERGFWEELLLKRQSWYQELSTRVIDSRLLLVTTISAISAGAVAFVAGYLDFQNNLTKISLFSFSLCAFFGPLALAFASFLDGTRIPKNRDLEIGTIKKLKDSAESLYYKGIEGDLIEADIKGHFGLKKNIEGEITSPPKRDLVKEVLSGVFYSCLILYFIGVFTLMLNILLGSKSFQKF